MNAGSPNCSDFHVKMGPAFIEFRYDRIEGGVRYTFNMDDERVECSMACLETYRWWTATAVTAYVERGEDDRTTALASLRSSIGVRNTSTG